MAKYLVGIPYMVWIETEADNEQDAQTEALNTNFDLIDDNGNQNVTIELQEWNDLVVYRDQNNA